MRKKIVIVLVVLFLGFLILVLMQPAWSGNNDQGEGLQEIIESEAPKHIRIHLEFTRPFKAVSLFMDCDKMVGPDFEKGLSQLRTVCEAP